MGIAEALTFDDVTLIPGYSAILPSEADTSVKLSKKENWSLNTVNGNIPSTLNLNSPRTGVIF